MLVPHYLYCDFGIGMGMLKKQPESESRNCGCAAVKRFLKKVLVGGLL